MIEPEARARRLVGAMRLFPSREDKVRIAEAAIRDAVVEERARAIAVVEGAELPVCVPTLSDAEATKAAMVAAIRGEAGK